MLFKNTEFVCGDDPDGASKMPQLRGHDHNGAGSIMLWAGFEMNYKMPLQHHVERNLRGIQYKDDIVQLLELLVLQANGQR